VASNRKKPGVAFWATVILLTVPMFYIASLGPMVMATRPMLASYPDQRFEIYAVYMAPANHVLAHLPLPAQRAIRDYLLWWAPADVRARAAK